MGIMVRGAVGKRIRYLDLVAYKGARSMATEMTTVIKKIVPYLQRRGYSLENNMFFGERADDDQDRIGFVDILVKRSPRATKPLFVIEAKRDSAKLNASHRKQAIRYGKALECPLVVVTNGEDFELHNVATSKRLKINGSIIGKVPLYSRIDAVLRQFRENRLLDNIDLATDNSIPYRPGLNLPQLQALIRRCHNTIRNVEKDEENVFSDVSKLLFLKLLEEKQDRSELGFTLPYSYRFHELAQRRDAPDQVKDAVLSMMRQVVNLPNYGDVMTPTLFMEKPTTFLKVVSELSKADFSDSELDVRGSVFEYFVRLSLKGRRLGQFFTPRPLVRFMLSIIPIEQTIPDLLDSETHPIILDPACGSGGFLLAAMNTLLDKVDSETGSTYSTERADWLRERIKRDVFWGADANQRIASTAKMNMIIAGDGFANIRHGDSLTEEIDFLKVRERSIGLADYVLTNPPFGMSESDTLTAADFAVFPNPIAKTQGLFLQKMALITKPKGRICTVIDEGMLNTAAVSNIRRYLIKECFIDAVVRLPDVTFNPNKINVRSSVLLMTRKPDEDAEQDYPIRMIELRQLGYDSSGEEDTVTPIDEIIDLIRTRWSDIGSIPLSLADTGGVFRSYPLEIADVVALDDTRFDFKYYDPDALGLIKQLEDAGAKSLEQLTSVSIHRGKSPSKSEYNVGLDSDIKVVKAGNIGRVGFAREFDLINEHVYARLASARISENDVLLASTGEGTLGKAIVYDADVRAIADSHVSIIRLKDDILPEYAVWFLRSELGQRQIQRLFTGATGLIELPEDAVKRILLLTPTDKSEQQSLVRGWVAEVREAEALENEARAKRQQAHDQFVESLQSYMTDI